MKKLKYFGLLLLVLVLSLAFIACDSGLGGTGDTGPTGGSEGSGVTGGNKGGGGGGGGGGYGGGLFPNPTPQTPRVLTFTGGVYTITITEKPSRAAYQPKTGDSYEIKSGKNTISSGKVTVTDDTNIPGKFNYKFVPDSTKAEVAFFEATFENGVLTFTNPIPKDDGTGTITIPPLDAVGYGVVDSDPIDTGTTFAGITYSRKDINSITWESNGTHYLIPGTFEAAYGILSDPGAWDEPDMTFEDGIFYVTGATALSNGLKKGTITGVLFEVNNSTTTDPDGTPVIDYKLAGLVSGAWRVVSWIASNPKVTAPVVDDSDADNLKIGELTYTQKEPYTMIDKVEWANYILTITYDAALTKLKEDWGNPFTNWPISEYGRNTLTEADSVIINKVKKTYSDNTTAGYYSLAKYDEELEDWFGVAWQMLPD